MSLMGWGSDSKPMRNGVWLGSLGIMDSVLVLAHRQSESERSYHENWPFGGEIQFEPSTAQIDENQDLAAYTLFKSTCST